MNWKTKGLIQKTLSAIPGGYRCNHLLQKNLGHLRSAITPRSGHDLKAMFGEGTYQQGREKALGADALRVLFRRPFCGRTSRMALGSEPSAFRATHNGSAERKRNRGIRVRESEESCHGQVERLSSIVHAEGVREYCSTDN